VTTVVKQTTSTVIKQSTSTATATATVVVELRIQNVLYSKLMENAALRMQFESAVKRAIASNAGVPVSQVTLTLSAGSVVVDAVVTPPTGTTASAVKASIDAASSGPNATLAQDVVTRVSGISGIASVQQGGPIGVVGLNVAVKEPTRFGLKISNCQQLLLSWAVAVAAISLVCTRDHAH